MLVPLRTVELLALLTMAGLPLSLMFLGVADKANGTHSRILLAPLTGLAYLALLSGLYYAFGIPVNQIGLPFWLGVLALWLATLGRGRRWRNLHLAASSLALLRWACIVVGALPVLIVYLWPFLQDSRLVFWHNAGSDGYMYMRIAEVVGQNGTSQTPKVGTYDAATGYVLEQLLTFRADRFVEKPGTMGVFAGAAALLGLLPHEVFSPLTVASLVLVYLSLVAFGRWLQLSYIPSALFAVFGALGPVPWLMATSTFLGNVLALPFFPLFLPLCKPMSNRLAAYCGLLLAAQTLLFPDATLVVVGLLAPPVLFHVVRAMRTGTLQRFGAMIGVGVAAWSLPLLPLGKVLVGTIAYRLILVSASGLAAGRDSSTGFVRHSLESVNWLWPVVNLNVLPPEPLRSDQAPYVLALICAVLVYGGCCRWSHSADLTLFGVISMSLLLVVGVLGGIFLSDYELFRALAVFFFVPLAVLFALPARVGGVVRSGRPRVIAMIVAALAIVPVVARFAANDRYQFDLVYGAHLPDAQYTADDVRARLDVQSLLGSRRIVLSSETPSFTAFANVLMLFSSSNLGVPNAFYKFVFLTGPGAMADTSEVFLRRDEQYTSDLVLRNTRYDDIFDPSAFIPSVYRSDDFAVFENDLIPFFDNDTFTVENAFPSAFARPRGMELARLLSDQTEVAFFSKVNRHVDVELEFAGPNPPRSVPVTFDDRAAQVVQLDANDRLRLSLQCDAGLHKLVLGPLESPAKVSAFRLSQSP